MNNILFNVYTIQLFVRHLNEKEEKTKTNGDCAKIIKSDVNLIFFGQNCNYSINISPHDKFFPEQFHGTSSAFCRSILRIFPQIVFSN